MITSVAILPILFISERFRDAGRGFHPVCQLDYIALRLLDAARGARAMR
jgi:hypothetical protein